MRNRQHKSLKAILRILAATGLALACLFVGGYTGYKYGMRRAFDAPLVARFRSPTSADLELWLMEEGFRKKGLFFCVRSTATREVPLRLASLDAKDTYSFAYAQWTKDGRAIVIGLNVGKGNDLPIAAIAYDFDRNAPIMPAAFSDGKKVELSRTAWLEQEQKILALAKAHGGLLDWRIDRETFAAEADVYTAGNIR